MPTFPELIEYAASLDPEQASDTIYLAQDFLNQLCSRIAPLRHWDHPLTQFEGNLYLESHKILPFPPFLNGPSCASMESVITLNLCGAVDAEKLCRIEQAQNQILERISELMSKVSEFAAKEQADLKSLDDKIMSIASGVVALDDAIKALQAGATSLSAEDQAALDEVVKSSDALVAKATAIDTTVPVPVAATPVPAPGPTPAPPSATDPTTVI